LLKVLTNPKHEAFAQAVAAGSTGAAAYRNHVSSKALDNSAQTGAGRLLADPKIAARVAELKRQVEKIADEVFHFTKADLLRWHLSVLQTPVSEIDEDHRLCQEYSLSATGAMKVKMVPKMDAAKQIAAMCGWNTADEAAKKTADGLTELLTDLRKR